MDSAESPNINYRGIIGREQREFKTILDRLFPATIICIVIIGLLNYYLEDVIFPPGPWDEIVTALLNTVLIFWLIYHFLGKLKAVEAEREKMMVSVVRSQERLEGVVDNVWSVIFLNDIEGKFLLVNKEFERVFNVKRREVVGRTADEVLPKAMAETLRSIYREVQRSTLPLQAEQTFVGADGVARTYLCEQFPVLDPGGQIHATGGIATDVSNVRR